MVHEEQKSNEANHNSCEHCASTETSNRQINSFVSTLIIALLFLLLGAGGMYVALNYTLEKKQNSPEIPVTQYPPDRDTTETAMQPSSFPEEDSIADITTVPTINLDPQGIKQAMADKYGRPVSDVIMTIKTNDGTYASGGVKFQGSIGGGMFFAYRNNDTWTILSDGNGVPMCSDIEPYNFPVSLIDTCSLPNGNVKKR